MTTTLAASVLDKIGHLRVWKRGGQRAPHKPLLVLLALSRVFHGRPRLATFEELEPPLLRLLEKYCSTPRTQASHPFWRLPSDGLWEIPNSGLLPLRSHGTEPYRSELIDSQIEGGFPLEIFQAFKSDGHLLAQAVELALKTYFAPSLRAGLITELNLEAALPNKSLLRITED